MTKYETLLENASDAGVIVDETSHFCGTKIKGLYLDKHIAISKDISTDTEKACILAEELGHHYTATGNILDQSTVENRKQEMRGRIVAYNKLVGLRGIVDAYLHHCQSISESAEYLEVTEEFLIDSLTYYRNKYGVYTKLDNYVIVFEPNIAVLELV
nr:MAG TPA: IrrE protein [Caudoviricetes sp.]DAJ21050.1 MAG TPA: IrrE protein [Siphoviridae sp. ctoD011]DAN97384.1 MAG TPA: IrrE protein [Caudoviricetes sp.]